MDITLVEEDIKRREQSLQSLQGSLAYLKVEEAKHTEAIYLVSYQIFSIKDQLGNYRMLLDMLKDEVKSAEVPKKD